LLITDFHRRLGIGRSWLADKLGKPADSLGEEDELRLDRPLVLVIGVAATLFSLIVAQIGDIFSIMIAVVNTFGGPLLAVFLLGVFTRRCTARAALVSLVAGTLFTIWITVANSYTAFAWLWPFEERLASTWSVIFGVGFTVLFGYAASFFIGNRKPKDELRGLVVGVGHLGNREPEEMEVIIIEEPDE
jgi:Na+/proline symporter